MYSLGAGNLLMSDNFWIDALCLRGEIFYNKTSINKIVESLERGFMEFSDISIVYIVLEFFANCALLTKRQYSHLHKYPLQTSAPQTRATPRSYNEFTLRKEKVDEK